VNLSRPVRLGVIFAALVLVSACSSKADRIQQGLNKGAEFLKHADWDKANVEVRNVLQIDPKNAEAFFIAGQVAEAKREMQRAFGSYLKVIELKPDHIEAKVGLGRIHLLAGETEKSEQSITEVLTVSPNNVGARTVKAALLARKGNVPGGIALAKSLVDEQKEKTPVETSMLLAGLYTSQKDNVKALWVIEAALQLEPKNLGLITVAAQIASNDADPAMQTKALAFMRRGTEVAPKNIDLWNAWAVYHARRKEFDSAEGVLRASIKSQPDDSQRTLALLEFLSVRGGKEVAEKEFVAAIAAKPKDPVLRFGLVNLYRGQGRQADVRRVLQEMLDVYQTEPGGLSARNQLAADRLANGKNEEARKLLDEVLVASPRDGTALVMRGRMRLANGDATNAIIDLRAASKDQPGSAEVAGLLAQAHRKAGEPQLAREVLADAVKFKPEDADLRMLLAADLADAKEFREAGTEIDSALKAAPQNLRAYDFKAQLAMAQQDIPAAERTFVSLKTNFPNDPAGALKLGKFYSDQKKFDAALKEYDAAAKLAPNAVEPALYSIGILCALKRFDEANARIDAIAKRDPKQVLPYQLRAELAVAKGDLPQADAAYRKMIEFAPTVPNGYTALARIKAQRGGVPDALAVLAEGEKAIPADNTLTSARAEWLTRADRTDEAIAVYETLVKRAPDDDSYANNLSYLLTEKKGDKASLERGLEIAKRFKESRNPSYLDTLGWIHYKLGDYASAVPVLERATVSAPDAPLLQLHLGMALYKKGDVTKAQDHLHRAVDSKAVLPNLEEARALIAAR
jgi:tetratricopeptide (TPR) repeat protein